MSLKVFDNGPECRPYSLWRTDDCSWVCGPWKHRWTVEVYRAWLIVTGRG